MKIIIYFTLILIISGCNSTNKLFTNEELIIYDTKDKFLLNSIDIYKEALVRKYNDPNSAGYKKKLIIMLSKDFHNPKKQNI
jgi:hypothetical protein